LDVGTKKVLLDVEAAAGRLEEGSENAVAATGEAVAENTAPGVEEKKQMRPGEGFREYTDREFREAYPQICAALIAKAIDADVAKIKMLLEIIFGRYGGPEQAKQQGGKSLSELLMDELKRRQDEREAAADAAKAEEQVANDAGNGDAGNEGAKSGGEAE
jgi:hypothetical protein